MLLKKTRNPSKPNTRVQIFAYNKSIENQNREIYSMIRRELLDRAVEQEMERYCLEEMEFDEPFLEQAEELLHSEVNNNPIKERSLEIRQAIEEVTLP